MTVPTAAPPSRCPFTRTTQLLGKVFQRERDNTREAEHLRVRVVKDGEERVSLFLPARSARWMIDLIPSGVLRQIHAEGIPLERIQDELKARPRLLPQRIFEVADSERIVAVWLE